jgi:MFS family permease
MSDESDEQAGAVSEEAGRTFLFSIIALTFAMNLMARGVPETFAVFLLPVQKGLGVSRADITLTYSSYMLAYGLFGPFVGQVVDRFGVRVAYGLGLIALGIGYVLAGFANELWQYMVAVGLLGGLGAAALGMIVASALLSRWFTRRMGSIVSLPYAAIGAGTLLLPPLTQALLHIYSWREVHTLLGIGVLLVLPLVMLLPLGRMTGGSVEWRRLRASAAESPASSWNTMKALRTSAFWGLFAAYFFTSVASFSVTPHSVAYLIERGFEPMVAASAFGFAGMLSACGIVLMGSLSDYFGRKQTATISYISTIIGIASLALVTVIPSLVLVAGFVFFFGLMQGVRGPIIVALVANLFRGGVGAVYGALSVSPGIGAAIGSWASGLLYEWTGSYVASFTLAIGAAFLGMASFWVVRSLREEKLAPPAARTAAP